MTDNILTYLDDIFVYSFNKDVDEHLYIIKCLFIQIRKYGLILKMGKTEFLKKETNILGLPIDSECLKLDQEKVNIINSLRPPTNKTYLRSLLGMLNYVRIFIPNFSLIASPLYELTKKNNP